MFILIQNNDNMLEKYMEKIIVWGEFKSKGVVKI